MNVSNKRGRGRPKGYKKPDPPSKRMRSLIPEDDIFEPDEKIVYNNILDAYLDDFDQKQMTSQDMDDLMSMAMNRVLEIRLLKMSKGTPSRMVDISTSIEKIRRQSEKLKENLASRRKDRVDPKKYSEFSIIDVLADYDSSRKQVMDDKVKKFLEEEKDIVESPLLVGNKDDEDASIVDREE